ncbi:MAG: ATP-binding protein [Deltaproteobacteria bacterium]|nr:ATP-binding protein [Deltaproteobacteria bacterium]
MKNPFVYTSTVEGESFCNRKQELRDLTDFCLDGQNIFLYAHRRCGKTSLIKVLLDRLNKTNPDIKTFYIDLYGTLDEKDFIASIFSSFSQVETKLEKLAKTMKTLFSNVRPKLSYNPDNNKIEVEASYNPNEKTLVFNEVVESLSRYSKKTGTVVVFDEFQEINDYGDKTIEKRLRKVIQYHRNVCYVFMGSQRRMLEQMFTENSRALYNIAAPYPLSHIDTRHYRTWVKGLFRKYDKNPPADEVIDGIVVACENHPLFVQQFFYFLWREPEITPQIVQNIEEKILERRFHEYANIWDKLTPNQKKTCALLYKFGGENIYQVKNFQQVGLKGSSQVKKAVEYLIDNEIVYRNGNYRFSDVMFKKWIMRLISK